MIQQVVNPGNYAFSLHAMPMLLIGVAVACLGFLVLIRERMSRAGVSFLLMCLPISLYQVTAALNYASRDIGLSLLLSKIGNLGIICIPSSILVLMTVLFGLTHRYRYVIAASIILSILFTLGLFFTDLHIRAIERFSWGWYAQFGPLGFVFICYFFAIMVMILRLLWQEYHRCTTERQMKRYRGLLTAFIGGYLGSVDFLAAFGVPVYPFGYVAVGFFIAVCTYVILRYRLVDITPELAAGQILETMQGAIIVTGMDGRIRVINHRAVEMLGYPRLELLGRDLVAVLPIPSELIAEVRVGRRAVSREMSWPGRNEAHDVSLSASLLTESRNGESIGIVYAAYDISDRKQAEEALRIQEERLRLAMEATQQGWFDLNVQTGEVSVSPEYARMIGYEPGEFRSNLQTWFEAIHPEDRDALMKAYQDCTTTGGPCTMEYRRRTKTGEWKWIRSIGKVVTSDPSGKPLRMSGTHSDISDRKHAEEALQRIEQFNRNILDSVDEGFIVVDRDYRIMVANKAYCDLVGLPSFDVVGNHCYRVSHKRDRPCHEAGEECAVQQVFKTGEPYTAYHKHSDAAGNVLYVEAKAFPLSRESGAVTSVIESVNNITEKYLLEEERLKTQKLEAIGILAGGIAHDFNNLLQGVFGYISLAKMLADTKEKSLEALVQAEKALHMSVRLTNQLLTFSKGGKPLKKPVALWPVIENAAKFALSGSRSDFRIVTDEGLWLADADEGQISQVIQNIVLNADQAMPDGGQIEITARNIHVSGSNLPQNLQKGAYVEIAIKDPGIGIPAHYLGRIFDPYFTTKEKGSGLGLATAYSIMKNHKGLISVTSTIGIGTTFLLYLPAAEAPPREDRCAPAAASAGGRSGRILVMDDEQVIRNVAAAMLRALGHEVVVTAEGREAVEAYQRAKRTEMPFDVVILDLTIRDGMGGIETLHHLIEIEPGVQAVVSSGYSDDAAVSNYRDKGFKAFLKKPYTIGALRDVLNALLKA